MAARNAKLDDLTDLYCLVVVIRRYLFESKDWHSPLVRECATFFARGPEFDSQVWPLILQISTSPFSVQKAAVFVTSRNTPSFWGGALRDKTETAA